MSISWEEALGLTTPSKSVEPATRKMHKNAQITEKVLTPKKQAIDNRKKQLVKLLRNVPSVPAAAKQLQVHHTTLYRDLADLSGDEQAAYIRSKWYHLLDRLEQDHEVELFNALTRVVTKFFEKQANVEVKVKQEITEHKTVNVNVKALLSEYADLFTQQEDENDGSQETTISNNNST